MKKYVLIIMDGAADRARICGKSPLQIARTPNIDYLTSIGASGLMTTLYDDLPKGSIVAQLGMFGYEPHKYYPHGRSSCEALAIGICLNDKDLSFRANFTSFKKNILDSYNADNIKSKDAYPLILRLEDELKDDFPEFELYHNSDFRNTLVIRNANIHPSFLICPEPHESMGKKFDLSNLLKAKDEQAKGIAIRINSFIKRSAEILKDEQANALIPWSPSSALKLPDFSDNIKIKGKYGVISHMDFLHGIAKAAGIDSFKIGNGDWNTDYASKSHTLNELLLKNYIFVACHINGPDESSHMGDIERKVYSIEQIDKHIVGPLITYFETYPKELGGVIVTPDHYTNYFPRKGELHRSETHSKEPVPFVLWNNFDRDNNTLFSEDDAVGGKFANPSINHNGILNLLTRVT